MPNDHGDISLLLSSVTILIIHFVNILAVQIILLLFGWLEILSGLNQNLKRKEKKTIRLLTNQALIVCLLFDRPLLA